MLLQLLTKLISFKTITGDTKEADRLYTWVMQTLSKQRLSARRFSHNGFTSLYISPTHSLRPDLLLAAHIDVVPGDAAQFKAKRSTKKLSGCGAYDMKFAVACYLDLFQTHGRMLRNKKIGILLTSDEEIGGMDGTKFVLESGLHPSHVFLPDAGPNWTIERLAKGVLHVEATAKGVSAHASTPWMGKNAALTLIRCLKELEGDFHNRKTSSTTLTIGTLHAGETINKIPSQAIAGLDFRYETSANLSAIKKQLRALHKKYGVKFREIISGRPHTVNTKDSAILLFRRLAKSMHRKNMLFSVSHGGSDARFYAAKNIPVLLTTPTGGGHHSNHEWIDIQELKKFNEIFQQFVLQLLS